MLEEGFVLLLTNDAFTLLRRIAVALALLAIAGVSSGGGGDAADTSESMGEGRRTVARDEARDMHEEEESEAHGAEAAEFAACRAAVSAATVAKNVGLPRRFGAVPLVHAACHDDTPLLRHFAHRCFVRKKLRSSSFQ